MFPTMSKKLALTLVLYVALVLPSFAEANNLAPMYRRQHGALSRLARKRSPQVVVIPGDGNDPPPPPPPRPSPSSSPASSQAVPSSSPVPATSAPASPPPAGPATVTTTQASASQTTTTTAASATSSSDVVSSSSSSSLSTTAPLTGLPTTTFRPSDVFVTSTAVAAAEPTESSTPVGASKTAKFITTALIAVAASVAAIVIIWTIIRKWKFSKSEAFEDRMQPIDWQPTAPGDDDGGLPVHRRASVASSFQSAGHEHNLAGQGVAFGGGSMDYNHGAPTLGPLPDHDFTAGTNSNLAPVGGYADLARGPSPQPQMQEAYPFGSMGYAGHGSQDAYDYNGGAGVRY